jgi:hypothetical protein
LTTERRDECVPLGRLAATGGVEPADGSAESASGPTGAKWGDMLESLIESGWAETSSSAVAFARRDDGPVGVGSDADGSHDSLFASFAG